MIKQSKGKIFLADERGINERAGFRSLRTFNFETYFNEHKRPLGDLCVLNDDVLDSGRSVRQSVEERSYVIWLPVVGVISYTDLTAYYHLVAAGQLLITLLGQGCNFEVTNSYVA